VTERLSPPGIFYHQLGAFVRMYVIGHVTKTTRMAESIHIEDGNMKTWLCDVCKGFGNPNRVDSSPEGCMCKKECKPNDGECINTRYKNRAIWYLRVLDLQPTDKTIEWVDANFPAPISIRKNHSNYFWMIMGPPKKIQWQNVPNGGNYGERMDQLEKHIKCLDEKLDYHMRTKLPHGYGMNN